MVLGPWLQGVWRRLALRPPGIVVVPVTGRASTADWTSTVQSDRWWRWLGGQRTLFVGSEVRLSSRQWFGQGWLVSSSFGDFWG
jgi:hypothetical protein